VIGKRVLLLMTALVMLGCSGGGGGDDGQGEPPNTSVVPPLPAEPASLSLPWWNRAVFYEVFVRSFYDARSGAKADDGIGDLQGLIEKLDYLNDGNPATDTDLGVTALWLMPIFQSPSYHGYDTTDYRAIERDYGDNALFRTFMAECAQRGIRVILDLVLNHASSSHPYFLSSKSSSSEYRDWFIWRDTNPGFQGPWGQQVWHQSGASFYYGVFWSGMPDLNYENADVTAFAHDVTRFWLEEMDVDGFRLDAIRHLIENGSDQEDTNGTHQWLTDYYQFYKGIKEDAFTVGEVWADAATVATYQGQMDTNFQFDLATAFLDAVNAGTAFRVEAGLQTTWDSFDHGQFSTFLTNHDQDRVMDQLGGSVAKAKLAATLLLTTPGIPFIYYGEEIGMRGSKPDELIRKPMQWTGAQYAGFSARSPWQSVNSDFQQGVNVAAQRADDDSLWNLYRRLIHLRNDHPALLEGNYTRVEVSDNGIFAFLRQAPGQSVLVLVNMSASAKTDYTVSVNGDFDGAAELLQGAVLTKGAEKQINGVPGFQPIAELAAQTGYIIRFP